MDWLQFLSQHRIDYVTAGPNTARGHVSVRCPWCGTADPSQHMGINLSGAGWGCLRNAEHRGKSPVRLVAALLRVPEAEAARLIGYSAPDTGDLLETVKALVEPTSRPETPIAPLTMPKEFQPFNRESVLAHPYYFHLQGTRGLSDPAIDTLTRRFDLRWCRRGEYSGRIIFPVRYNKRLVAWTGRHIHPDILPRYKASTGGERITDYLLWYDELIESNAHTIVIVEGPFDALKIWALGHHHGIVATALFTSHMSESQVSMAFDLLPQFKNRFTLLDSEGTVSQTNRIVRQLSLLNVQPRNLPSQFKDPDELKTIDQLKKALQL